MTEYLTDNEAMMGLMCALDADMVYQVAVLGDVFYG